MWLKAMDVVNFIDQHCGYRCVVSTYGKFCKWPTEEIREWMLILIIASWHTLCLRRLVCGVIVHYLCFGCFLCFVNAMCCHPLPYETMDLAHNVTSWHCAHHCTKTSISVTHAKCPYDNPHPRVYHINAIIYLLIYIYISQIYILHIYGVTTQGTCHAYPKLLHISPNRTGRREDAPR